MTMYLYFLQYNIYVFVHVLSPQQVGIPLRSPETSQIKQETISEPPPIIYWTILHMCGHDNIAQCITQLCVLHTCFQYASNLTLIVFIITKHVVCTA